MSTRYHTRERIGALRLSEYRDRLDYHSTKMGLVVIVVAPVLASKAASKARVGLLLAALRT